MVADFYRRLFEKAPDVRKLFSSDMTKQEAHLMAALATIAKNVDQMDVLEEPLMHLGAIHIQYGARPEHYPVVCDCLLEAVRNAAGAAWNDPLERDWSVALSMVCEAMLKGVLRAVAEQSRNP